MPDATIEEISRSGIQKNRLYASENINPIVKQIVVLCKMRLCSPALIGSGENINSDRDVYICTDGSPLLPGSSIAGILRNTLCIDDANMLFGKLIDRNEDKAGMSPLWVYDSPLFQKDSEMAAEIITIDNVSLDENRRNAPDMEYRSLAHLDHMNKTAADTGKFDFQAVERDSRFDLRLKLIVRANDAPAPAPTAAHVPPTISPDSSIQQPTHISNLETIFNNLLGKLNTLYVGGKTSRGFGKLKCSAIYKRVFNSTPNDLDEWLKFKWPDLESSAYKQPLPIPQNYASIEAALNLDSTLLIRDDYSILEDEDSAHITSADIPVIYGTSWVGAIRGGLARFLKTHGYNNCEDYLDKVFGNAKFDATNGNAQTEPSMLRVDASYFGEDETCDNRHCVTRVKIDRWTGGAVDTALFTTRPQFGGNVILTIHYPEGDAAIRELLILALQAIDLGIITIGGETSIGRGLFRVTEIYIDGVKQTDINALYNTPKGALGLCLNT